ncbi:DUF748 domain-containing protein [Ramlibacter sp. G-1-2-2]|uniref:DUF748 domain-containing protein n=1 Tax=Ramlibacter agri TaxID=2728837 RepID=A0A848H5J7_9BURK|nr:DUF748 domain-containing protein [Ramlibacter agri]NML44791.1 DUF748 domain-containing protein [Ramlibacter agri]
MWRRILKHALSWPVLLLAGLYAAWLLFGFFAVDPLARRLLPWAGDRFLASRLSVERVDFNPFTLELRARGLALADPQGAPLAGFDQLHANLQVDGLRRWAWHLQDVELQHPRLNLELRQGGATNWDALLHRLQENAGAPSDSMVRLLIDRIKLADGDILVVDASRPGTPVRAALQPLNIDLDALSTLPKDRGAYLLAARLPEQGATLRWKGEIALNPLNSRGEIALDGARVAKLMQALGSVRAESAGTLAATVPYRFEMVRTGQHTQAASFAVSNAQILVRDFTLAAAGGGEPLLAVPEARVSDLSLDSTSRQLRIGAVNLKGGKLAAARDAQGVIDWQKLLPAEATGADQDGGRPPWRIAVQDVHFAGWSARWKDEAYVRPIGVAAEAMDLHATLSGDVGTTLSLALGPVNATVGPVQLSSAGEPVAQLQRVELKDLRVQLPEQKIRAESLALAGARATIKLDAKQRINWADILELRPGESRAVQIQASAPPDLEVARVSAQDVELRIEDASTAQPVVLELAEGRLATQNVRLDPSRAFPLEAAFAVRPGGRIDVRGSVVPGQPSGKLELRLAGLPLKPFAPYVNRFARLKLESGSANLDGKLAFGPGKAGLAVTGNGAFAVDELAIREEDTGDPFLGWKQLASQHVAFTTAPMRLQVGEIVARSPFAKVIIFPDRSLNLQHIRRDDGAAPAAAAAAAASDASGPGFPVTVDRLRIIDGSGEFADLSLTPQFGTKMHELDGVVAGLTTDPSATAQVELDGKVDDYGSVRVRGSVQPFHATDATDIALAFRNLEMARLTPYSGKFAGRRIESGKLSVDLEYKIQHRQLAGANKFVVNRLKLGERVDSPDAMKLPLDLAIALLQDSDGVIDVDLPVRGSLDDPQFSYGAVVWKAIVNVLTKIVTAPFRALGSLLGADSEKFEKVGFDPGSSALAPPEQEKLKLLAQALQKRPALTVSIQPGYDPAADRRALQEDAMRRAAAEASGLRVEAGQDPGPVDVNLYKVQTWLEDRYAAQAGKDDYEKLRAGYKDAEGKKGVMDTQVVERLGRHFGNRDSGPPSAFHAELLERLTKQVPVADSALVALANARAATLREAVVQQGLDAQRVTVGEPAQQAMQDKQVATVLALGAGAAAPAQQPVAWQRASADQARPRRRRPPTSSPNPNRFRRRG